MERFELNLLTYVHIENGDYLSKYSGNYMATSNISSCGIYLGTNHFLPVNTKVRLYVYLPLCRSFNEILLVELKGVVIRNKPDGFAVRLDEEYRISAPETDGCIERYRFKDQGYTEAKSKPPVKSK